MSHNPSRRTFALAAATLLASTLAVAAPGGPGGPMGGGGAGPMGGPGHMRGPGGPGMGGPAMSGGLVEHVIDGVKDKLSLDAAQLAMFDSARAQTVAARDKMVTSRTDVRTKVQAELAKAEPDLAAVSSLLESAEEQGRALRHQTRDQWLKVYASLRADQKLMVRDELKARMARMDGMQDRMRERRGQGPT